MKRRRSSNSYFNLAKKLAAIALSKQSPTDPIAGRTHVSVRRYPKALDVCYILSVVMMHHLPRSPLPIGLLRRLRYEVAAKMILHRLAHLPTAEGIDCHRDVEQKSNLPGNVSDIGHPQRVGRFSTELTLHRSGTRGASASPTSSPIPIARASLLFGEEV